MRSSLALYVVFYLYVCAAILGDVYKVRNATPKWMPGTKGCEFICGCHSDSVTWHDPPLLFDIVADPSEEHPLDITLPLHQAMVTQLNAYVADFQSSLDTSIVDQFYTFRLLGRPWMQPCCAPDCLCQELEAPFFVEHT